MEFKMSLVSVVLIVICPALGKDLKPLIGRERIEILPSNIQTLPYKQKLDRSKITLYRNDGRCGKSFPIKEGISSQCDPTTEGNERGPCCSSASWCGNSEAHCKCEGCIDYRTQVVKYKDTERVPSATVSPFKQLSDLLSVVSGDNLEDYRDSKYDSDNSKPSTTPNPPPSGQKEHNAPPNHPIFAYPAHV